MTSLSFALCDTYFDFYETCAKCACSGYKEELSVAFVVISPLAEYARNAHIPLIGKVLFPI